MMNILLKSLNDPARMALATSFTGKQTEAQRGEVAGGHTGRKLRGRGSNPDCLAPRMVPATLLPYLLTHQAKGVSLWR